MKSADSPTTAAGKISEDQCIPVSRLKILFRRQFLLPVLLTASFFILHTGCNQDCDCLYGPAPITMRLAPDGSGDHATIRDAVVAAVDGDTIIMADGIYSGEGNRDIRFWKGLVFRSEGGDPARCIIDCGGDLVDPHYGFNVTSFVGRKSTVVFDGIGIRKANVLNSRIQPYGGAALVRGSVTFINCSFSDCSADWVSCVACFHGTAMFVDCTFASNHGSAVACWNSSAYFLNCVFTDNSGYQGGAIDLWEGSDAEITNCLFLDNSAEHSGGAISCSRSSPVIRGCTFVGNATLWGGAVSCREEAFPRFVSCSFLGNRAGVGGGLYCERDCALYLERTIVSFSIDAEAVGTDSTSSAFLVCCNLYGNGGGDWVGPVADQATVEGNSSADPLFCDPESPDLYLRSDSPCTAESNPNCGLIGAWTVGCDRR
jgi:predicted outer membrane repeat protein